MESRRGIRLGLAVAILGATLALPACSTVKGVFGLDHPPVAQRPISNPFGHYSPGRSGGQDTIVLRTRKGDRAIEVELPGQHGAMTDFVVPVSPAFRDAGRGPASVDGEVDERYLGRRPGMSDREITRTLPNNLPEHEGDRREVETALGLVPSEDDRPDDDSSYLGAVDHVKQLYRAARYEPALMELDQLIRAYPTDPRLHQMRGTLLDRLGRGDLALKSWTQALRYEPTNASLRRFVERKQAQRSIASQPGAGGAR